MDDEEKSFSVFYWHIVIWKLYYLYPVDNYRNNFFKHLHTVLAVGLHILLDICYPLTMLTGLFQQTNAQDILENVAMALSMISEPVKALCVRFYIKNWFRMAEIMDTIEPKFRSDEYGAKEFKVCKKWSRIYFRVFVCHFSSVVFASFYTIITMPRNRLQYPAYFPFDWEHNDFYFVVVRFYQYVGWACVVYYNSTMDSYPPMAMYLLTTSLKVLSKRISLIGYDGKENAHELLREAITDHKLLVEYFNLLNEIVSIGMFGMFIVVTINLVSTIILLIYFVDSPAEQMYFVTLCSAYALEIILSCYYGSVFTEINDGLKSAIYECNWMDQSKSFKMDMVIFVENNLRQKEFIAGGIVPISLISFMKIMKSTYSTFTVMSQMSK